MPLTHLIIRILKVALIPLSLCGCVATAAAPVTLPIWFLFSIVVLFRPIKPESYARFTQIIVIQCLMMAAFGLVAWIDLMERNTGGIISTRTLGEALALYILGIVVAGFAWVVRQMTSYSESRLDGWLGCGVLFLMACGVVSSLLLLW